MTTTNTPNSTEGPPATTSNARGHAAAAAPSPTTVHAPSSTNTNSNYNNPPAANAAHQEAKVTPTGLNNLPAANETVAPRTLSNDESIELRKLLKATLKIAGTTLKIDSIATKEQDEEDAILLLDYAMDLVEDGESVGHIAGEVSARDKYIRRVFHATQYYFLALISLSRICVL